MLKDFHAFIRPEPGSVENRILFRDHRGSPASRRGQSHAKLYPVVGAGVSAGAMRNPTGAEKLLQNSFIVLRFRPAPEF